MELSFVQRIIKVNRPFTLLHTQSVTQETVKRAIASGKSIDLDISVDNSGNPYLGHSKEYYEKSGETQPDTMPFAEAIELVGKASIPVVLDCKHYDAWPVVEDAIKKVGARRCLVHSFGSELKFNYEYYDRDYLTEWSPIKKLTEIKNRFPAVTISASCKFLPNNLLLSPQHRKLLEKIQKVLKANRIDTVCLNIPYNTVSDEMLNFFLEQAIILHVVVDNIDVSKLSRLYIGETDILANASGCKLLGY